MALWKITYFFENIQAGDSSAAGASYGWTESWYTSSASITSLESALAFAKNRANYVTRRVAFLSGTCIVRWVRVSLIGSRAVKVAAVGQVGLGGIGAQTTCAVLVLFTAPPQTVAPVDTQSRRRAFLLRGVPASMMSGDILNTKTVPSAYSKLVDFCNFMVSAPTPGVAGSGSPWQLAYVDPAQLFVPVTNTEVLAANRRIIRLTTGQPGVAGDRVQLRRVDEPEGINHIWTVQNPGAGGILPVGQARRDLDTGSWAQDSAQVRKYVLLGRQPLNYLIVGMRTKKTGRPFRLPVGRRRVRT